MLFVLAVAALALAALYSFLTLVNLAIVRPPRPPARPGTPARLSVLIPARNEAATIGAALDAVLANDGAEFEVVVLDDGSTDDTAGIVQERAARDPRVRLVAGRALPPGWNGKQHACWLLSQSARHDLFVFIDSDVRLAPDALAAIAHYMDRKRLDLASGFPRQITLTLAEKVVIPQILVLLFGYLPIPFARLSGSPGFAAACGQLIAVRREAYARAGGHAAIGGSMHDGLHLPRAIRASGGRTDLFDGTPVASCRMYDSFAGIWSGFSKNATEGMARPVALPVWTVLLGGGHVLPFLTAAAALASGQAQALQVSLLAVLCLVTARAALAIRARQGAVSVLLHPVGICVALAIQWSAFLNARRGRQVTWRGRTYDV